MSMMVNLRWVVGSGTAVLLFGVGCFPQSIDLEHDAGGAAGAGAYSGTGGKGGVTGTGGESSTAESQPGDSCEASCGAGFWCLKPKAGGPGICTPRCQDDRGGESWGQTCPNSVSGAPGVCRPFSSNDPGGSTTAVGICTVGCDPLLQDCPSHFACDITEDRLDVAPNRVFSCLPVVEPEPHLEGDDCYGAGLGECALGLGCVYPGDGDAGTCRVFCDSTAAEPCRPSQHCEIPYYYPPGTTVGVCVND